MKDYKLPKDKHLTPEARQEIERCLDMGGISFKDQGKPFCKSHIFDIASSRPALLLILPLDSLLANILHAFPY